METHDTAAGKPVHTGRRVILAGATGLVGRELRRLLLKDPTVEAVHVFPSGTLTSLPLGAEG